MNFTNHSSPIGIKGFTLIELLTVIAIIGILAAILIPVVGRVRESARAAQCMSNIRQVSVAMLAYSDENNGVLPTSGGLDGGDGEKEDTDWILWRGYDPDDIEKIRRSAIVPYLGGSFSPDIYRCPSDDDYMSRTYKFSFTLNRALGERNPNFSWAQLNGRVHSVAHPSLIILLAEEDNPNDSSAVLHAADDRLTDRHGGRGHVSFVDGHVRAVYPEYAAWPAHWNPFHEGTRPYPGRR